MGVPPRRSRRAGEKWKKSTHGETPGPCKKEPGLQNATREPRSLNLAPEISTIPAGFGIDWHG